MSVKNYNLNQVAHSISLYKLGKGDKKSGHLWNLVVLGKKSCES